MQWQTTKRPYFYSSNRNETCRHMSFGKTAFFFDAFKHKIIMILHASSFRREFNRIGRRERRRRRRREESFHLSKIRIFNRNAEDFFPISPSHWLNQHEKSDKKKNETHAYKNAVPYSMHTTLICTVIRDADRFYSLSNSRLVVSQLKCVCAYKYIVNVMHMCMRDAHFFLPRSKTNQPILVDAMNIIIIKYIIYVALVTHFWTDSNSFDRIFEMQHPSSCTLT